MKLKKNPPAESERICGNCKWYQLRKISDAGPWKMAWVCYSPLANPDRKDPLDGVGLYNRKACIYWGW